MKSSPKINLFLRVVGKRPDGYHELETFFYPLQGPSDEVVLTRCAGQGVGVSSNHPGVPADKSNLCVKALLAFCEAAQIPADGFHIQLEKNIPVAAGLGGGSSNAAAILRQMKEMFPDAVSEGQLHDIAVKIGADVPFFLNPVPTVAYGIGEKFRALQNIPVKLPILLAAPCFPVSAKWAYQHWNAQNNEELPLEPLIEALQARDFRCAAKFLRNDLQFSVLRKFPLLQMIREEFQRVGAASVLMSGSGPTMFAMFDSFEARDVAKENFQADLLRVRVF